MDRHRAGRDHVTRLRLDRPALGHPVAARGEAEERRQLDDLGLGEMLAQLSIDLVVTPVVEKFDKSGGGNYLYGADAVWTGLKKAAIEPYEFVRRANTLKTEAGLAGELTSSTTGVRIVP